MRGQYFEPIPPSEIVAYSVLLRMAGIEMTAIDWDIMLRLDSVWMECVPKPAGP